MALTTVTLTGRFLNPDSSPARGAGLVLRLTAAMLDANDNVIVAAEPVRVTLDSQGTFSIPVVPSDGAGLAPNPVPYEVTEMFGSKRRYMVLIPSANPDVDIADLAPIGEPPTPPSVYALQSALDTVATDAATEVATAQAAAIAHADTGDALLIPLAQKGAANGVASLDAGGKVPTGELALTASDVGLGNVDNTADVDKPVSTAQQTALDTKAPSAGAATISGSWNFTTAPTINGQPISTSAEVVSAGNLGTAYSLNLSVHQPDLYLRGTLNGNCTLTVTNAAAGDRVTLLLLQDATGGRTLTIAYGAGSQVVSIDTTANGVSVVELSFDGTDCFISGGVGMSATLMDAKGDLLVGTADNTVSRLAVGTNGKVLMADSTQTAGVKWADAAGLGIGQVQQNFVHTGEYHGPNATTGTNARPQGLLEVAPIFLPACSLDRIRTNVTSAGGTGATVRLGIYSDDGTGKPSSLLVDGGTVAADTTGLKEVTITLAVSAGLYWIATASQDSAVIPTRQACSAVGAKVVPLPRNGSSGWFTGYSSPTTINTGALPASFGTPALSGAAGFADVRIA